MTVAQGKARPSGGGPPPGFVDWLLGPLSADPVSLITFAVLASLLITALNHGLAVADNKDLTKWHFLPPVLSANCVNDQTERPQIFIQSEGGKNKYYLFTISHQFTYADGMRGPDGVYGFVGDGVRSDDPFEHAGQCPRRTGPPPERPPVPGLLALRSAGRAGAVLYRQRERCTRRFPLAHREDQLPQRSFGR